MMPTDATYSIDALLDIAEIDAAAGVQITSPAGLRALHPSVATLVLLDGAGLPAEALRRYPEATEVVRISERADGFRAEVGTVSTLNAEANGSTGALVAVLLAAVPADEMRLDMDGLRGVSPDRGM